MTWKPLPSDRDIQEPKPIARGLERFAQSLGMSDGATTKTLFGSWKELVGDQLSAHTKPVSLIRQNLVVEVDQAAWAAQVRYMEASLLDSFAKSLGAGQVQKITVRTKR